MACACIRIRLKHGEGDEEERQSEQSPSSPQPQPQGSNRSRGQSQGSRSPRRQSPTSVAERSPRVSAEDAVRDNNVCPRQRYRGDFCSHDKVWPKYKRMETTNSGVKFWARVRHSVEMEFVRKEKMQMMTNTRRTAKHVTWSKSVEDLEDEHNLKLRVSSLDVAAAGQLAERIPFLGSSDDVEAYHYDNDKMAWELGQRLIAEGVDDDN